MGLDEGSCVFDGSHAEMVFFWQLEFLNALWLQGSMLDHVIKLYNHEAILTDLPFAFVQSEIFVLSNHIFPYCDFVSSVLKGRNLKGIEVDAKREWFLAFTAYHEMFSIWMDSFSFLF